MSNKQARIKSMKNTTFESAMNSSSFASTESAAQKNTKLNDIYVVIGITPYGRKEITDMMIDEKELLSSIEEARSCGEYIFVTYYDVARLAKIHVKPEDIDDFLFYYGIAEEYGLELEYLQSILNGLAPAGAAYEWDL